jgi:hypothetical protein
VTNIFEICATLADPGIVTTASFHPAVHDASGHERRFMQSHIDADTFPTHSNCGHQANIITTSRALLYTTLHLITSAPLFSEHYLHFAFLALLVGFVHACLAMVGFERLQTFLYNTVQLLHTERDFEHGLFSAYI